MNERHHGICQLSFASTPQISGELGAKLTGYRVKLTGHAYKPESGGRPTLAEEGD